MPTILDLPLEILELIVVRLIDDDNPWDHHLHHQSFRRSRSACLRLVCQAYRRTDYMSIIVCIACCVYIVVLDLLLLSRTWADVPRLFPALGINT
jgi:hypothetical protein